MQPRVPRRLRVILAEILDEIGEARVGDARQVRGGMRAVGAHAAIALDQRHREARALQQIG